MMPLSGLNGHPGSLPPAMTSYGLPQGHLQPNYAGYQPDYTPHPLDASTKRRRIGDHVYATEGPSTMLQRSIDASQAINPAAVLNKGSFPLSRNDISTIARANLASVSSEQSFMMPPPVEVKQATKKASAKGKGKAAANASKKRSDKPKGKPRGRAAAKSHSATPDPDGVFYTNRQVSAHAYDPDAPEEEEEVDDREYCICKERYDPQKDMICCDRCEGWYHLAVCLFSSKNYETQEKCLNMFDEELDLVNDFVCPLCTASTGKYTTWKQRCSRPTCLRARVALSKYCSDYCGIEVAADRLDACTLDPKRVRKSVKNASKRRAFVVEAEVHREDAFCVPVYSSVTPPRKTREKGYNALTTSADAGSAFVMAHRSEPDPSEERRKNVDIINGYKRTLEDLDAQRTRAEEAKRQSDRRDAFIDETITQWEVKVQEFERTTSIQPGPINKKAAKKKQGLAGEAPCGFDMRLSWDDEEFYAWLERRTAADYTADAEEEAGNICTITCKRCDRHSDWQKLHKAAVELEQAVQTNKLERLDILQKNLQKQISQAEADMAFRDAVSTTQATKEEQEQMVDIFT